MRVVMVDGCGGWGRVNAVAEGLHGGGGDGEEE